MPARLDKDGQTLIPRLEMALGLLERMRGLLGRAGLDPDQGMFLSPCDSIHTLGMQFAIDVFFVDPAGVVRKIVRDVGPGRLVFGGPGVSSTIETAAGALPVDGITVGDRLTWTEIEKGT